MMAYFYLFELKLKSIDRILNIYGLDYDKKVSFITTWCQK